MDNTVSATGNKSESTPPLHPRAEWAKFLRVACAGCRIDTSRPAGSEK